MRAQDQRGHECYHCRQWIPNGIEHDCWTTTEGALTRDLSEDIHDAWERLRETAADFGEQRIYASHSSIMFARKVCYLFVRPKTKRLEVVFFLGRRLRSPLIRRIEPTSKVKFAHIVHVVHRDEVEPPLTDWLKEAYDVSPALSAKPSRKGRPAPKAAATRKRRVRKK